jgi:hypothetical protein
MNPQLSYRRIFSRHGIIHKNACEGAFFLTDYSYVSGLGTFGALSHFKFNFIAFFK